MMNGQVRIRCIGLFDEPLTEPERIEAVMKSIENGENRRPEFELLVPSRGAERPILAAALFREGTDCVEGWLVSHSSRVKGESVAYCATRSLDHEAAYKEVLLCGAPESIRACAVLSRTETIDLLQSLIHNLASGYEATPFAFVFEGLS